MAKALCSEVFRYMVGV